MIKNNLFTLDQDLMMCQINLEQRTADDNALDIIYENVKDIKHAHISLSGGVDSQFWLRVCEHFNIPYTASTYLTTWQGAPINTDDFTCAEMTAKKFNSDWNVIEIDIEKFLKSDELRSVAKQYKTDSQQICLHLHYFKKIINENSTFLLGSDAMYLEVKNNIPDLSILNYEVITTSIPYYNFFKSNNIKFIKDVAYLDKKMPSILLDYNLQFIKEHKKHLERNPNASSLPAERLEVKSYIWESILPGTVNTLIKVGGFERLKKYLAMKSGVYNQFDIDYRIPLQQYMTNDPGMPSKKSDMRIVFRNKEILDNYKKKFGNAITKYNSTPIQEYLFDF